jgi:predicted dehydrogenase
MAGFKTAVIGTNIGSTLHIRALQATGFEVTALVGRNPERTAERAKHFGIPLATTSVEKVIDSDVEVLVIATPPTSHREIALAAIKAGKHILCEKPLADTSAAAAEMRDAANASNVVCILQHQLRWRTSTAMLRETIGKGALGTLIQGAFDLDIPMMQKPEIDVPDWWLASETGGGWLRNCNTHGIDLVRYMIGEFAAISGQVHNDPSRGMTSDDSYVAHFVLKNGMQGSMTGTCRTWYPHVHTRVVGSDATALFQRGKDGADELVLANKDGVKALTPSAALLADLQIKPNDAIADPGLPDMGPGVYQDIHARQPWSEQVSLCRAFARRLKDRNYKNPGLGGFDDGVIEMQIVEAMERSQRERRWIDVA